jgi:antitoxin component YwqK of YwqJK toxin-antitoxin module
MVSASYLNDKLEGPYLRYYPQSYGGKLRFKANYSNGFMLGKVIEYYQDGQVSTVHHYKTERVTVSITPNAFTKGLVPTLLEPQKLQVAHGNFIGFYANGEKRYELSYDSNKLIDEYYWNYRYNKHEILAQGKFKNGHCFNGDFIFYSVDEKYPMRQLPSYKYWLHSYKNGWLVKKKLLVDTKLEPLAQPKSKRKKNK